ncbi:MAG: O-antigen ligase family protein, partial [bacterium]|nr:O-antigen ligase family protein [bacterium]
YYPAPARSLNWLGISFLAIGLSQYVFFPTINYYNPEGWDPHAYRLFGSFLNPNLYGLVLFFYFIYYFNSSIKPAFKHILIGLSLLALFLTFSRSLYLILAIWFVYYLFKSKPKPKLTHFFIMIFTSLVLIVSLLFIGYRVHGEGVKIWRLSTVNARLAEYKQASQLFANHPLWGIGFNNIKLYKTKFLLSNPKSHSQGWYSSFVFTLLTTSGLVGFVFWLLFLISLWHVLRFETIKLMFAFWLFHSEFHASFFYPFAILVFFLIAGGMKQKKLSREYEK